ncbi:MAG TPA: arginine--tRNA ligase [Thermoplasmata archaeon]|nr:arginine--tRNA ligase [Thermoplasmata archaeon]
MGAASGGSGTTDLDPWNPLTSKLLEELGRLLAPAGPLGPGTLLENLLAADEGSEWDLALPLHRFAKPLGASAVDLASRFAAGFPPVEGLAAAVATGPYLNFRADRPWLTQRTLDLALGQGNAYGEGAPKATRVCVEHTSANPNGPFHIGRIRNALIGDTLARTLRTAGFPVTTQYYVDDIGRQAAMITWIWSKPLDSWPPEIRATLEGSDAAAEKPDHYLGRPYPAVNEYLKSHPEADGEVQRLTHALETGGRDARHRELVRQVLDGMLESLRGLGVSFDTFVWESDLIADGSVAKVVDRLHASPRAVQEENGAWAIDARGAGLPQDSERIIVTRADGSSLYATRDVAYHLQKFAAFDRIIDVLGSNHLLHAEVLRVLLKSIGETREPEVVLYQYITAAGGGGMSTRRGTAVHLDDLLEEAVVRAHGEISKRRTDLSEPEMGSIANSVAAGAIRYHILRVAADKTVAFRWDDALSFEGRTGPFAQYSYARASSILRKAELPPGPLGFTADALSTPEEWVVIRRISRFPSLVAYVARSSHVHALAGYAHSLAEEFNRFYQAVPVLKAGPARESRLALVAAFRQTLGNCLTLLGLERLERM